MAGSTSRQPHLPSGTAKPDGQSAQPTGTQASSPMTATGPGAHASPGSRGAQPSPLATPTSGQSGGGSPVALVLLGGASSPPQPHKEAIAQHASTRPGAGMRIEQASRKSAPRTTCDTLG